MDKNTLFIEETLPDKSYQVIWKGTHVGYEDISVALDNLLNLPTSNRIELWSKAHAESPKGFAPLAFREANSPKGKCQISNTLKMLMGN